MLYHLSGKGFRSPQDRGRTWRRDRRQQVLPVLFFHSSVLHSEGTRRDGGGQKAHGQNALLNIHFISQEAENIIGEDEWVSLRYAPGKGESDR